jgi:predicted nuclease with TOPRIM domain
MEKENEIIQGLASRVEKIMGLYQEVKKENEALLKQNDELKVKVDKKEKHLFEIEKKHENMVMAKTIASSDSEDTAEMKLKINGLVREIDKCIALLNV